LSRLRQLAAQEAKPRLSALIRAADAHGLRHVMDDSSVTFGGGATGCSIPL